MFSRKEYFYSVEREKDCVKVYTWSALPWSFPLKRIFAMKQSIFELKQAEIMSICDIHIRTNGLSNKAINVWMLTCI